MLLTNVTAESYAFQRNMWILAKDWDLTPTWFLIEKSKNCGLNA